MMKNKIFLSGPITGEPDYYEKFLAAETYLKCKGWRVLNPAVLPDNLDPDDYLPITTAMIDRADAVVLLQGFAHSEGAKVEYLYSEYQKKTIYGSLESVPFIREED